MSVLNGLRRYSLSTLLSCVRWALRRSPGIASGSYRSASVDPGCPERASSTSRAPWPGTCARSTGAKGSPPCQGRTPSRPRREAVAWPEPAGRAPYAPRAGGAGLRAPTAETPRRGPGGGRPCAAGRAAASFQWPPSPQARPAAPTAPARTAAGSPISAGLRAASGPPGARPGEAHATGAARVILPVPCPRGRRCAPSCTPPWRRASLGRSCAWRCSCGGCAERPRRCTRPSSSGPSAWSW